MASAIPGLRFVLCPKCRNLLTELASVPVYKCGVCGTTLQSKHYNATRENSTAATQISSENQPDSSSFDKGSTSRNEITVCPSEDRAQDVASPSPQASNMDAPTGGAELKHEESCSKDRGSAGSTSHVPPDDRNVGPMTHLTESSIHESASLEDKETRNVLQSNSTRSYASDGSNSGTPRKHISLSLSRRTFRQRKVQDSEDTSAHKVEGTKEMVAAQDVLQPSEENTDAIDRLNSDAKDCSQKEKDHVAKDTSLDAKGFESVENLKESENHRPSESPSRDAQVCQQGSAKNRNGSVSAELKSLGRIQMKILRKVDELREEINEIFDKSDEGKGRSHRKAIQEEGQIKNLNSAFARRPPKPQYQRKDIPRPSRFANIPCKHCQHATCIGYRNGFCAACHHDRTRNPSATCSPRNHVDHRFSPSHHESRIEHEPERSYGKERRQQKKRPCRPVLGGAPFVICYNCLELLKLPIDFFIVSKRLYKLQCGACSKVLTYSFRGRNHDGIPDTPNEIETPTTEVESQSSAGHDEILNSHMNDKSQWDPVSYSEDYGLSLGISYSTDAELQDQIPSSSRAMVKRHGKPKTGSELHMLLGYGSASELLYRHSDIDEGSEITEATMPLCNTPESAFAGDVMDRRGSYVSDPSTSRYY